MKNKTLRILGVDPGTSLIGYGIIDVNGKNYKPVDSGAFKTLANVRNSERVEEIYTFFKGLIKKHRPDEVAIESIFFFKNQKTIITVSEIRGVILLAAAKSGVTIREFTPLQVKQAVSGYGRAEKLQVGSMVKLILNLKKIPSPNDISDALAIAICCANTRN